MKGIKIFVKNSRAQYLLYTVLKKITPRIKGFEGETNLEKRSVIYVAQLVSVNWPDLSEKIVFSPEKKTDNNGSIKLSVDPFSIRRSRSIKTVRIGQNPFDSITIS